MGGNRVSLRLLHYYPMGVKNVMPTFTTILPPVESLGIGKYAYLQPILNNSLGWDALLYMNEDDLVELYDGEGSTYKAADIMAFCSTVLKPLQTRYWHWYHNVGWSPKSHADFTVLFDLNFGDKL